MIVYLYQDNEKEKINMGNLNYLDKKGTFTLDDPDLTSTCQ